jgi:hypothetical protein
MNIRAVVFAFVVALLGCAVLDAQGPKGPVIAPGGSGGNPSVGTSGRINAADGSGGWIDGGCDVTEGGFLCGDGTTDIVGDPVAFSTITVDPGRIYCGPNSEDSNIFSCKHDDGTIRKMSRPVDVNSTAGGHVTFFPMPAATAASQSALGAATKTVNFFEAETIYATATISKLALWATANGASGTTGLAAAIYRASDCSLVAKATTITGLNGGANTRKLLTFSPAVTLAPGNYIIGIATDEPAPFALAGIGSTNSAVVSDGTNHRAFTVSGVVAANNGSAMDMPSSCAGTRASNLFLVAYGLP